MAVNVIVGNDGSNNLQGSASQDLIYGFDPNGPQGNVSSITATRVATGLGTALFAVAAPNDPGRLFVVTQTGTVRIVDLTSGQVLATPFLSVAVDSTGERGLLGFAFDPDYATNGFFYIYRTVPGPGVHNAIERYQVSADPNVANVASATTIIRLDNLSAANHNAGWIGFGPDGYLYVATGDNAVAANAQNSGNLLGKILRIDVRNDAFPGDPTRNYAIPSGNMFAAVGDPGADEIFALGLRNPFRDSFDRATGNFFIADVGQSAFEEIDIGLSGANYGWPLFEGPSGSGTVAHGTLTAPIHSYGRDVGQAVIGGYVYRGLSEGLQGQFFFADQPTGKIFTLRLIGGTWTATDRTSQIVPDAGAVNIPTSFGEDARGNLYIVDYDGDVFRLTPQVVSADQNDTLHGLDGDDLLYGGSGNDFLDGGTGIDILNGGPGNDTLIVDSAGDTINENRNEGTDAVYASVTYTMAENVEGMVLQQAGGAIDGFGSDGNDTIFGNGFTNFLWGGGGNDALLGGGGNDVLNGGAEVDGMAGGLGDDTYVIDNAFDQIQENPGEGADTVYAGASFALFENLEGLVLLEGAGAINGTGSEGNDTIFGNSSANTLNGRGGSDALIGGGGNDVLVGGSGVDGMAGGLGDDIYGVDSALDQIQENAGEGADTVYAGATFTLFDNVEGLVLLESAGAIDGRGNGGDNYLFGNSSANTLHGGGANDVLFGGGDDDMLNGDGGNDRLIGGAGNDFFAFETGFGRDSIEDFTAGDRIVFNQAVFANFAAVQANMAELDADTTVIVVDANNMIAVHHAAGVTLTQNDFLFV